MLPSPAVWFNLISLYFRFRETVPNSEIYNKGWNLTCHLPDLEMLEGGGEGIMLEGGRG